MSKRKLEKTTQNTNPSANEETKPVQVAGNKQIENQEPLVIVEAFEENTAETSPKPKKRRRVNKWVWLGILGMLIIAGIGAAIGYGSGMQVRKDAETTGRITLATTQFELALQDQEQGRLDIARQRFEYVLKIYPDYPGIEEKLVEVGMAIAQGQGGTIIGTPQPGVTPQVNVNPAPGANAQTLSALMKQAKSQHSAQDWPGLYNSVIKIRDINPNYSAVKVDGLYYSALRNLGISEISAGNLEVGLYDFSLAEQMSPIDTEAESYRTWARMYLTAGSWWGINWPNAIQKFAELYQIVPNLLDSSKFSVRQRYAGSLEGYGDFLQMTYEWCAAVPQYEAAASILPSDVINEKISRGQKLCANPPATPTPTIDPYAPTPTPTKKPKNN